MPKVYRIRLRQAQRRELEEARDHHAKPYVRERAAAVLKVADRHSLRQVALHGLLKRRAPETVKRWCERYRREGSAGLLVVEGRGRKPRFFPLSASGGERASEHSAAPVPV